MFRKPNLFPSSGEEREISTLLGPLESANLKHWTRNPMTLSVIRHRQKPLDFSFLF
jgi:hypothetical protein